MASTLFKQTKSITIINVISHVKRSRIPPKLMKRIERQQKVCEQAFNHTVKLSDWKSEIKLKTNTLDEEYNIDDRSVTEAASYNSIVVGSPNYSQQYPMIAYQNLGLIYNFGQRRLPRKAWDVPYSISTESGVRLFTPISFPDQLPSTKSNKKKKSRQSKVLPFTLQSTECPSSLIRLKDGTDRNQMPFFVNDDLGVSILIYRDIPSNIKSRNRIRKVIDNFNPDTIITECNASDFQQYQNGSNSLRNTVYSTLQYLIPSVLNMNLKFNGSSDVAAAVMDTVRNRNHKGINVIAGGLQGEYQQLLSHYCYLVDLFSLSAIEISPILPNRIIPKKISTISTKLLSGNSKITSEMRYLIHPYFFPHSHLLGQIMNSYLMHCLYGCHRELDAKRILMVVNDDNVFDLITKMSSSEEIGFYHKYSYSSLFKQVDEEFVTMPGLLPASYSRNSSLKLQESEWKRLHSMFGLQFVKFVEHEMEMRQALVVK